MLSLFVLDIEEAIRGLATLVDVVHLGITGQDLAALDEQCDSSLFAKLHTLSNDLMELQSLEIIRDQEPKPPYIVYLDIPIQVCNVETRSSY